MAKTKSERRLLKVPEVAPRLGLSKWALYEVIRQGRLPPGVVVRIGPRIRIDPEALDEWIAQGGELQGEGEG